MHAMNMQKQRRINIDFTNARSRFSQRTNEATLVVGRKNGDDVISANSNKPINQSPRVTSIDNKANQESKLHNVKRGKDPN